MSSNDRTPGRTGYPQPSHASPRYAGFWVLLTAFLSFVLCAPLLYFLAVGPAVVSALLALWVAIELKRRARRRGRRDLLAPLWVVLVGLSPALILWLLVLPRLISRGLFD